MNNSHSDKIMDNDNSNKEPSVPRPLTNCAGVCSCVGVREGMYIRVYLHMCIHVYMYICVYIYIIICICEYVCIHVYYRRSPANFFPALLFLPYSQNVCTHSFEEKIVALRQFFGRD